ncbi:MAG: peptidoglycan-binding domain-containing protein, partial [Pseudomonadota bacterium]
GLLCAAVPPLLAPSPAVAQEVAEPDRAGVAELQTNLNALGYDAGPADGLAGPRTAAAIEAWQRDRGLSVTGRADTAILETLRAEMAARAEDGAEDATVDATEDDADDAGAPVVAGTRPGAVAAPAPPAEQPVPSVSSPARRATGEAGSIAARRGLGQGDPGTPSGLTPHGRRAEAPAPRGGATLDDADQQTVRADTSLPRVRHRTQEGPAAGDRPRGVGTLAGEGRIGDRPAPPPSYSERGPTGSQPGGDGMGSPGLVGLPLLPAITPPEWLTKTRLAIALGTLALLSLLCHRIARRPRRSTARNARHSTERGNRRDTTVTAAKAAPLR